MPHKGKIQSWNDDKGFGFVAPLDGGAKIFVHIKAFKNRSRRPEVNEVVTYSVSKDHQGRTRAVNAVFAGDKPSRRSRPNHGPPAKLLTIIFFAIIGASTFFTKFPPYILGACLLVSMITFIVYAMDKSAARADLQRTPESTLHFLALVGGWPGAMLAQQYLRHKSKKASFRTVFWTTVLLNCAALVWLHTSEGRLFLNQLIELVTRMAFK